MSKKNNALKRQIEEDAILDFQTEVKAEEEALNQTSIIHEKIFEDNTPKNDSMENKPNSDTEASSEDKNNEKTEYTHEEAVKEEIDHLLNQKKILEEDLMAINSRLRELQGEPEPEAVSKMDKMKKIYEEVGGVRKDFFKIVLESGLAGKAYASTAYNLIKKQN